MVTGHGIAPELISNLRNKAHLDIQDDQDGICWMDLIWMEQCRWPMFISAVSTCPYPLRSCRYEFFRSPLEEKSKFDKGKGRVSMTLNELKYRLAMISHSPSQSISIRNAAKSVWTLLDQAMASVATTAWDTRTALSSWATSPGLGHSCRAFTPCVAPCSKKKRYNLEIE